MLKPGDLDTHFRTNGHMYKDSSSSINPQGNGGVPFELPWDPDKITAIPGGLGYQSQATSYLEKPKRLSKCNVVSRNLTSYPQVVCPHMSEHPDIRIPELLKDPSVEFLNE